ncbi:hypothetical protein LF41_291 [Lysobacter dokdonensis DS-58]|uniref:Uncharacterized protein n=1 Tax=Lysobacter dokdonensis DS-58 TaxID=1300345 RepID=A0A0A2WG43_9GAMM|nr:hypothetical protein LF41_291 [Lysobacter dokdonensis DS-58]
MRGARSRTLHSQGLPCWQPQAHAAAACVLDWHPHVQAAPMQSVQAQALGCVFMSRSGCRGQARSACMQSPRPRRRNLERIG